MGDWGAMGGFGFIFWLVILAVILAAVAWLARSSAPTHHGLAPPAPEPRSPRLEALEERYSAAKSAAKNTCRRNATSPVEDGRENKGHGASRRQGLERAA
jgi:hypothetical protein